MKPILLGALLVSAVAAAAHAAPPDDPDPALAPWFESLRQPFTGAPCCAEADCRVTDYRESADGYEAKVDQRWPVSWSLWLKVPAERVLHRSENPTGHAVICFTPEAGILCFVPPAPES